ncbi:MAG TPA: hypothetical protein VF278_20295 [Pirellulales bacterium]
MSLICFLRAVYETGRVPVDDPDTPLETSATEVDALLAAFDVRARDELAFTAPAFIPEAARWSAALMYRGCQALVFRRLDEPAVKEMLGASCPTPHSSGVIYSVDLMLRVLPELATMARAVAENDVLVGELRRIGAAWPLSSVGMPQIAANQLDQDALEIIMRDRSLRQLYLDRVIARRDRSRLERTDVRDGVRQAIGMYEELWPLP